jgi:hypothetical protein
MREEAQKVEVWIAFYGAAMPDEAQKVDVWIADCGWIMYARAE